MAASTYRRSGSVGSSRLWTPADSLDTSANYVEVAHFGLHIPNASSTVEFWSRCTTHAEAVAYATADSVQNPNNRFLGHVPFGDGNLYLDNGNIAVGGRLDAPAPPAAFSDWTHYALVVDMSVYQMRVYVNGTLYATSYNSSIYQAQDDSLNIGWWSYKNTYYPGRIGEFRVWNAARTAAQISANYTKVLEGARPGLVACWHLNDLLLPGGQVLDSSGHLYHGIIH